MSWHTVSSSTSQNPLVSNTLQGEMAACEKETEGKVYLLWYIKSTNSHAALVVDDKPFGAFAGFLSKESGSLKSLIERAKTDQLKSTLAIAVQRVKVDAIQYKKINEIISTPLPPLSTGTCMDTVFRILRTAGVEIQAPPFPVNQLPDVSRNYLQEARAKDPGARLGKLKYFGKSKDINEHGWTRYITNVVAMPFVTGFCATALAALISPTVYQIVYPLGIGIGGLGAAYTAYATQKAFSRLGIVRK